MDIGERASNIFSVVEQKPILNRGRRKRHIMKHIYFSLPVGQSTSIIIDKVFCLGNTGRTQKMVDIHIEELARLGIPSSSEVPSLSRITDILVTQNSKIQVMGKKTTGEVEFVLLLTGEGRYVTVGSDHADRELEAEGNIYTKQVCPKPIAKNAWPLEDVQSHWDEIRLTCEVLHEGKWEIYQDDLVATILSFEDIFRFIENRGQNNIKGTVLYCGTISLFSGKFIYASAYRLTLVDPVMERFITHTYEVDNILGS
jgi:hypothetical protein